MMDSPKHEAYENGGTIVNRYARIAIAVLASVDLLASASACGTSQDGAGSAHGAIPVVSPINQWAVSYTHLDVYKRQSPNACSVHVALRNA